MTKALELPLHMRRNGLNPVEELAQGRDSDGAVRVETPLGLPAYLICRQEDVRQVLADPAQIEPAAEELLRRLSIASPAPLRRFPGLTLADPDEQADFRAFSLVYGLNSLRVTW